MRLSRRRPGWVPCGSRPRTCSSRPRSQRAVPRRRSRSRSRSRRRRRTASRAGRLWARALYASGRQAEALEVITRLRKTLDDDLGIDLAPEVADLATAILRQDPSLEVRRVPSARRSRARVLVGGRSGGRPRSGGHRHRTPPARPGGRGRSGCGGDPARRGRRGAGGPGGCARPRRGVPGHRRLPDHPRQRAADVRQLRRPAQYRCPPPDAPWPKDAPVATSPDGRTTATAHAAAIQLAVDGQPTHRLVTPTDLPDRACVLPRRASTWRQA